MAKKETMKAKIARLEAENEQLRKKIEEIQKYYYDEVDINTQLSKKIDDQFTNSTVYKQLMKDIDILKRDNMLLRQHNQSLKDIRFEQAEKLERAYKLINEQKIKNSRGAGRKSTITEDMKEEFVRKHNNGQSMRSIAKEFGYSVGTISKIIKCSKIKY